MPKPAWLNRTVVGAGLTSFLADVGYEMACSLIPGFLLAIGLPGDKAAAVLGAVEAIAEFVSNAAKLLVGWFSDRIGRRKVFVVGGYALTGSAFALIAVGGTWPFVVLAKSLAWLGKGLRGPLRNAIITDAVDPAHRGKAFGFHRAGDTCGAVLGPLLAAAFLIWGPWEHSEGSTLGFRFAFWFTVIPGMAAAVTFALLVREVRFTPKPGLRLGASVGAMPKRYRTFLVGVGLFGVGDFSHLLLIALATSSAVDISLFDAWVGNPEEDYQGYRWRSYALAVGLPLVCYAWRNFCQAAAAFPAGWAADRHGHRRVLLVGYGLGAATMFAFAMLRLTQHHVTGLGPWLFLFALAGIYTAIQETVEPAIVPEFVPDPASRGTAFGLLATVNGFGDVIASLTVGLVAYAFGWPAALGYAALMMTVGTFWVSWLIPDENRLRSDGAGGS
jgi:MFS family permease